MSCALDRLSVVTLAAVLAGGAAVAAALAEKEKEKPPPIPAPGKTAGPRHVILTTPEDIEKEMAIMMPGAPHEKLMKLVGAWSIASTFEVPGQPAVPSMGTATIASAIDGRFLHETGAGAMFESPTQHFRTLGYNNGSKKYEAVWSWTMSTGFLYLSGQSSDEGATIDWNAWYDNEAGEREEFKARTTFTDDDHFTVELFGGTLPDGAPGPSMKSIYTRQQESDSSPPEKMD